MNLATINLNLLVAFDALMLERNVTRAAERIGLAQPSMSSALIRLRRLFDDPLFTRKGREMLPTARALVLAAPISTALEQLRSVLDPNSSFDPGTTKMRVRVAATDYGSLIIVPKVITALRKEAPGVNLRICPYVDPDKAFDELNRSEIDVALGVLPKSLNMVHHVLFLERDVCIQDAHRAAVDGVLSQDKYLRLPHAAFDFRDIGIIGKYGRLPMSRVALALAHHGETRRVALAVPHVAAVPFTITGTDLIATISERIARRFASAAGVAIMDVPYDIAPYTIDAVVARNRVGDVGLRWFVGLIQRACKGI